MAVASGFAGSVHGWQRVRSVLEVGKEKARVNKSKQGRAGSGAGRSGSEHLSEGLLTTPAHVAAQHSMGRQRSNYVIPVHGYVAPAVIHAFGKWHH